MTLVILQIVIGAIIVLATIGLGRAIRRDQELFGYLLLLGSGWYVFFGLLEGQSAAEMVPQLGGMVFFATLALVGLRYSVALIGVGWLLHITWDLGSLLVSGMSVAPDWTATVCIGFDIPAGIYLLLRAAGKLPLAPAAPAAQ